MFQGFPEETVRFFLDLRYNNNMTWFHAHNEEYEAYVRKPFYEFINELAPTALSVADDMEVRPHRCLARINRDIRFTRDKSPYRDHLWLLLRRAGEERDHSVMYWFELSPNNVTWGLGFWGPNRLAMDMLRKRMAEHPAAVKKALRQSGIPCDTLLVCGDFYKKMKMPDGLPPELKSLYPLKEMYIQRAPVPLSLAYGDQLLSMVRDDILQLKPMYHLMRECADEAMATLDP